MKSALYDIVGEGAVVLRQVPQSESLIAKLEEYAAEIDTVWSHELRRRPLFNGTVFSAQSIENKEGIITVSGSFVEYKSFLAQRVIGGLDLGIRAVGVSGIVILHDKAQQPCAVIAQRTNTVTEYQGFFELVPSGSIDASCQMDNQTIDYRQKLLDELAEETSWHSSGDAVSSLALVFDSAHMLYDICCMITLEESSEVLMRRFMGGTEYQVAQCVRLQDLDAFIHKNSNSIVPTSLAMLEVFRRNR